MCGIAGLWSPTRYSLETEKLAEKMADTLYHRGPDGRGFHFDADNRIAMIHTRLSIIGLNAGDQPIFGREQDGSGSLVLTANGEFYDC